MNTSMRLLDLGQVALALPIAHRGHVRLWAGQAPPIERLWMPLVLALLCWVGAAVVWHVYGSYRRESLFLEISRIARALALVTVVFASTIFTMEDGVVAPTLVALYFGTSLGLVVGTRIVLRLLSRSLRRRGYNTRRYAVVGSGPLAADIADTFASNPSWGFQLAGFILPGERSVEAPPGPVLGTLGDLERILDEQVLDEIVFALPRPEITGVERALLLCEEQGVAVVLCLEPLRVGNAEVSLFELSDRPMLVLSRTPRSAVGLAVKRVFDVLISAVALVLLAPAFAAVALAIKLDSRGPVLFRQRRIGRNGRPFMMLKLRTMQVDAEERLEALKASNEMDGPVFKMRKDPRVTRVGRLLRRTSLDEIPQFWNVLRGEMSVVGPRPPIPAEVSQYKRWQRRRLSMRPGITCTWQVSGRNEIDFERWMELDLEYIDNWTLWRDVEICLKTLPAVVTARGAR